MFHTAVPNEAFRQSEIISNIHQRVANLESLKLSGDKRMDVRRHPYAIILSQDCDLDLDYKSRNPSDNQDLKNLTAKTLPSILLCEVSTADAVRNSDGINSSIWGSVKINKDERYHFISEIPPEVDHQITGLPELCIDFKRYFTIPSEELYWQVESGECKRHVWLKSPYLEHLSHRFTNHLSRIALPHDYESSPVVI